jgi:hypothetical protein
MEDDLIPSSSRILSDRKIGTLARDIFRQRRPLTMTGTMTFCETARSHDPQQ